MKKLKVILPMLAFVFAIGLSFAFVNATGEDYYIAGYIEINGVPYPVDVDCDLQNPLNCQVEIEGVGTFQVLDIETGEPIKDSTGVPYSIPDPRENESVPE